MPQELKNKIKRRLFNPLTVATRGKLGVDEIRRVARSDPKDFMDKMTRAMESGDLALDRVNVRDMFNALLDVQVEARMDIMGQERAVMTGAFPLLVGGLAVNAMNAAYESLPTIGEELVRDIEDPKKVTTIAAIHSMDSDVQEVKEGDPFPEISAGEEKAEIRSKRNGRTLSITAETIEENDVADIVNRVNALSEISSDWVEEQTLDRVTDRYGSNTSSAAEPYVYRPNGSGTALYNSTANNPGTRAPSGTRVTNNPLVDEDSLEDARAVCAAMTNNRGKRINNPVSRMQLLVPDNLVAVGSKILNSTYAPGVENEKNNWGPEGRYRPTLVSSPKIDDIDTTTWYLGNFRQQFIRKWKLRFEYVTMAGTTKEFLERRIAFQARIAWDVEIGATDYVWVVQNLAGTTYTP